MMKQCVFLFGALCLSLSMVAQVTERKRPAEWDQLVPGARFIDRFLPMPQGKTATGLWGTDSVQHRFVDNGIELPATSFWGGNILQSADGEYHLFVCG